MSDLDNFLAEQEARMGLRDEPFEDYIARMTVAMDKDITQSIKTRRYHELENKAEIFAEEPPTKRQKTDCVPEATATDTVHQHHTNENFTSEKYRCLPVVQADPQSFSGLEDPNLDDQRNNSSHYAPERDGHENLASTDHHTTRMRVYGPTIPASFLINADESVPNSQDSNTRKGSGARLSMSRANNSAYTSQATSTKLLKNVTLIPLMSNLPDFADSPSVTTPAINSPQRTPSPDRSVNSESRPDFSKTRVWNQPFSDALRSKDATASRPKPQVRLKKVAQPLAAFSSVKISNLPSYRYGSKRDKVPKSTPILSHEVNTSVVTTPGIQPSSSSKLCLSRNSIPSAAPSASPSGKKITISTERVSARSKGRQKQKLVTPLEYAQVLSKDLEILAKKADFLKGKKLFYTGGDMQYASQSTKKRMELIIKNGGELIPNYDPERITHIISDAPEGPTLRALKLKSLADVAAHIPIVTWKWVVEGRGRTGLPEIEYAAFHKHMIQTSGLERQRTRTEKEKSMDLSRISQFTEDKQTTSAPQMEQNSSHFPQPLETSAHPVSTPEAHMFEEDPLAEFYDMAVIERDDDTSDHYDTRLPTHEEDSEDDLSDGEGFPKAVIKRGFTCDEKSSRPEGSKNQDIADKLEELMELHKSKPSKDDFWRGFSYGKSLGPIRNHPRRIRSYAEARSIRGVGHKTAEKIMEIINTGDLRRIAFEYTDDVDPIKTFSGIYGVGRTTAYQWYSNGCRTLDDVREGKNGVKLSPVMEIGLKFYDDINSRMPREEAGEIFNLIKHIALQLDPMLFFEIMGSFRRGKKDCGDIDILITRPTDDNQTHAGILPRLLKDLHMAGIITEDLALPDDMQSLEAIYRGLCKLPDRVGDNGEVVPSKRRRLDFLSVPWEHRGAALLYYTGDDIFNRAMRFKANKMGYSLNQRGLYSGVVRDPKDRRVKTNTGSLIASETEKEIFDILGVPWQEPHERVRSK